MSRHRTQHRLCLFECGKALCQHKVLAVGLSCFETHALKAILATRIHNPPGTRQIAPAQLKPQNKDPYTQHSEPIFVPTSRIQVAFPRTYFVLSAEGC